MKPTFQQKSFQMKNQCELKHLNCKVSLQTQQQNSFYYKAIFRRLIWQHILTFKRCSKTHKKSAFQRVANVYVQAPLQALFYVKTSKNFQNGKSIFGCFTFKRGGPQMAELINVKIQQQVVQQILQQKIKQKQKFYKEYYLNQKSESRNQKEKNMLCSGSTVEQIIFTLKFL
eukprot:TRINITY_DN756_c1_g1_i3.p3 TRINITY_DN756_c1_g1~~TRINITY_DN756_c1_g1_i3.p3  ORF type:complete len:172 (+),score=6.02 TRINITY_DN756_c1_g1_i3:359-874(+)